MSGLTVVAGGEEFTCNIDVLLCDGRYAEAGDILRDAESAYAHARDVGPGVCLTFDHDTLRAA